MSVQPSSPPTDFDFIIGSWRVAHRRLDERLVGCSTWTEFAGTSTTRKVLQGFGNVEDNELHFPGGSVRALGHRPDARHILNGGSGSIRASHRRSRRSR